MGTSATRAKQKYRDKAYDRIEIFVPKGQKEILKETAAKKGLSLSAWINRIIKEELQEKE